jgi:hypothetical protein
MQDPFSNTQKSHKVVHDLIASRFDGSPKTRGKSPPAPRSLILANVP